MFKGPHSAAWLSQIVTHLNFATVHFGKFAFHRGLTSGALKHGVRSSKTDSEGY